MKQEDKTNWIVTLLVVTLVMMLVSSAMSIVNIAVGWLL